MRILVIFLLSMSICACDQTSHDGEMQNRIDSLERKLTETYKPGFGEFMSGVQVHHAKLWFAGTNMNWPLADFEINEIREAIDDIQHFNTDRPESRSIGMIIPALDSVDNAIKQQNEQLFKSSYILLTNTCNSCHKATAHEFNVITIPSAPPVSNQSFKPPQ